MRDHLQALALLIGGLATFALVGALTWLTHGGFIIGLIIGILIIMAYFFCLEVVRDKRRQDERTAAWEASKYKGGSLKP